MQSLGKPTVDLETGGDGGRSSGEELCGSGGVAAEKRRRSSAASECLVDVDLETGDRENEGHLGKSVRDCRICHLGLDAENPDSGLPIELGCSCKDDLSVAHKHCAEAWFKIRGNKTCEICGSIAQSVVDINDAEHDPEHLEQSSDASTTAVTTEMPGPTTTSRDFWQGHRFLNFLLACMVFAFVISWLFHFNVPS